MAARTKRKKKRRTLDSKSMKGQSWVEVDAQSVLSLGILVDISSPPHDPRYAGEISCFLLLFFLIHAHACHGTDGLSWSLRWCPRARPRSAPLESLSLVLSFIPPNCQSTKYEGVCTTGEGRELWYWFCTSGEGRESMSCILAG